jgi:acyl-CoA dehydrogenase
MTLMMERPTDTASGWELASRVREFVDMHVAPVEHRLLAGGPDGVALLAHLQSLARQHGLWGIGYPVELGGRGLPLHEYLLVGEQEGRSQLGPMVFGSDTVVDTHMLNRHGTPTIRDQFLIPMIVSDAVPCYGMCEPGRTGSAPIGLHATASLANRMWTIRARKWFVSNAARASFMTVVVRTGGLGLPADRAFSLIVVPTDVPGFRLIRTQPVLGQFTGQCEVWLDGVTVPEDHLLGQAGRGMVVVRQRTALERVLQSMHWIGQAQRGFDLMCQRLRVRPTTGGLLRDRQLMQQHVFESYLEISAARALVRRAAARLDAGQSHGPDLSVAKVAASRAAWRVLDRAVQVFGAEGLSDDTPLSSMYRAARATRIMDGPDEIHIATGGCQLLSSSADSAGMDFTDPHDYRTHEKEL